MKLLKLKDSQYIDGEYIRRKQNEITSYLFAVDKLKHAIDKNEIDFFSLGGTNTKLNNDLIYSIRISYTEARFFTSHYVGFYTNNNVNIVIKPRFGNGIFNYLISYAYGVYLPKGSSSTDNEKSDSFWLIAMMWKATLQKAMTKSQIPKEYQKFEKNLNTYRGQLNISKHIKHNLFDKSKFYCTYRKLTMNTTINQTIRYVYNLLEKKGFGNLLKDIAEYDQMLQSFGVESKIIHQKNIHNIRYSKLNIYYKKVMELSSLILKSQSKSSDSSSSKNDSFSYFLDIAELWENYLLKVLQKNLSEYNIYSPNKKGGISLFDDGSREIRPDIIIERDGEVVAVLDAKYKWYNKIGRYADYDNAVSRDDLYQMSTYMYHYGRDDKNLVGLFISPMSQKHRHKKGDLKSLQNNANHQIGIINLDIAKFKNKDKVDTQIINKEEEFFIVNIKKALEESI